MSDVSDGLKKFISGYAAKYPDNKFHMPYQRKDLALDLVKLHDDRFSNLGGDKYFACVDMKGTDGKIYDIYFFMMVKARQIDRHGNVRSQDQRQTPLQLEAGRRRLEESKGFVNARQNGDHLGAKCLAPTAQIHASLGYRPKTGAISRTCAQKARFNPESRHETGNESRFQRFELAITQPGALPQANQVIAAPSALIVFESRAQVL